MHLDHFYLIFSCIFILDCTFSQSGLSSDDSYPNDSSQDGAFLNDFSTSTNLDLGLDHDASSSWVFQILTLPIKDSGLDLAVDISLPTVLPSPSPFGLNGLKLTHGWSNPTLAFAHAEDLSLAMSAAAIPWDRFELWWSLAEPKPGTFDWRFFDKATDFYRSHGLSILGMLGYASAWAGGAPPLNSTARTEFANFASQAVTRYKHTIRHWQVWNEPNIPTFWPAPDPAAYAALLKATYQAVKAADPSAKVILGPTSGVDLGFLQTVVDAGANTSFDILSIHPYSLAGDPVHQQLDALIAYTQNFANAIQPTSPPVPIWITEIGWQTAGSLTPTEQAAYLLQLYAIALARGVERIFWFCLEDFAEPWGIMTAGQPPQPKESFIAYQQLVSRLSPQGHPPIFEGYLPLGKDLAVLVFKNSNTELVAIIWCVSCQDTEKMVAAIPKGAILAVWDILGAPVSLPINGLLQVSALPYFAILDPSIIGASLRRTLENTPFDRPAESNWIYNTSFEIQDNSWPRYWVKGSLSGDGTNGNFQSSPDAHTGSMAMALSANGTDSAILSSLPVPIAPGKKYKLSVYVKGSGLLMAGSVRVDFHGGDQWSYQGNASSGVELSLGQWQQITLEEVAPPKAGFARIRLEGTLLSSSIIFDDIFFSEMP